MAVVKRALIPRLQLEMHFPLPRHFHPRGNSAFNASTIASEPLLRQSLPVQISTTAMGTSRVASPKTTGDTSGHAPSVASAVGCRVSFVAVVEDAVTSSTAKPAPKASALSVSS
jgi:hypothetical protein